MGGGLGFRVILRVDRFKVWGGLRFRVSGFGFRVEGLRSWRLCSWIPCLAEAAMATLPTGTQTLCPEGLRLMIYILHCIHNKEYAP